MNKRRSSNTDPIVTFAILPIGISCVVIKLCIMAGILKVCDGDMDMESWDSLMYANVLRMIELGNAAMMSYFRHCTTLKRKSLQQTVAVIKSSPNGNLNSPNGNRTRLPEFK